VGAYRIGYQCEDKDKQQDSCQCCDKTFGPIKCAEFVTSQLSVS